VAKHFHPLLQLFAALLQFLLNPGLDFQLELLPLPLHFLLQTAESPARLLRGFAILFGFQFYLRPQSGNQVPGFT